MAARLTKMAALSLLMNVLGLAAAATATAANPGSDDSKMAKPKASSSAPHHVKSHVYGAPISKPILHKRKKPARPKTPPPAEPIK